MDLKSVLQRENDRIHDQLVRICEDLSDEQVNFAHEAVDDRGIANVVVHLHGMVANRTEALLGKPYPEGQDEPPRTHDALMDYIEGVYKRASDALSQVEDAQLAATVTLRAGRQMQGFEAMMQGFSHAYRHIGTILDARHLGGFETHALG